MVEESNPTEWVTTIEAAELTGYHAVHIRRLVKDGYVRGRKFGRDWMLDKESVLAYAQKMEALGTAKHDPTRHKDT